MGVEPTGAGIADAHTVLKTGEATGPRPPPGECPPATGVRPKYTGDQHHAPLTEVRQTEDDRGLSRAHSELYERPPRSEVGTDRRGAPSSPPGDARSRPLIPL